jgi:hypothetical protein
MSAAGLSKRLNIASSAANESAGEVSKLLKRGALKRFGKE